jgi:hypothetical protein
MTDGISSAVTPHEATPEDAVLSHGLMRAGSAASGYEDRPGYGRVSVLMRTVLPTE